MKLKCCPLTPMTQEEMERQCKLVSNAAKVMGPDFDSDLQSVLVNVKTLECVVVDK